MNYIFEFFFFFFFSTFFFFFFKNEKIRDLKKKKVKGQSQVTVIYGFYDSPAKLRFRLNLDSQM